ncbi:hypothetical protein AVEN_22518-1 [Araneus ventricosus]|uniref:Uncharacterized protein n=1 Tax=Araneus ventricosus TaxID=182803 RepID=A0A4Y2S460_ARAVE|nr:hypothetical protein AVEN_22518-1 [Araneus ventricosus]
MMMDQYLIHILRCPIYRMILDRGSFPVNLYALSITSIRTDSLGNQKNAPVALMMAPYLITSLTTLFTMILDRGSFLVTFMLWAYQNRFFGKPKECSRGTDDGTISHCIFDCPIYNDIRQVLSGNFHALGIPEIIHHPKVKTGLRSIVQNLLEKCIHTT